MLSIVVGHLIARIRILRYERVLVFLLQWLTVFGFIIFLTFSTDFLFSFTFIRNTLFRLLTLVILFLYLLLFSHNRSYKPRINTTFLLLGLLFFIMCLSAVINGTALTSFWGDYLRMDGIFSFGHYLVFVFVVSSVFRNFSDWHKIFQFIVFIAFMTALVATSQTLHHPLLIESAGGIRASSTFGNVNYFGFFQSLAFFLSLYVAIHPSLRQLNLLIWFFAVADVFILVFEAIAHSFYSQVGFLGLLIGNLYLLLIWLWPQFWLLRFRVQNKPWQRWLALGSILILQLTALWFSGARSSIIATALAILILVGYWFYILSRQLSGLRRVILGLIFSGCIITLGMFQWVRIAPVIRDPNSFNSLSDRLIVWNISRNAFWEKPWLGWGPENFSQAFNNYYNDNIFRSGLSPIWYDKAHNVFIQYLVEEGAIGLIVYLAIILMIARSYIHLWRHRPAERNAWIVLACGGLAYLLQSFFYFDTINNLLLFFLIVAYLWSRENELSHAIKKYGLPLRVPFGRPVFFFLVSIITVLFAYNFYIYNILANYNFSQKLISIRSNLSQLTDKKLEQLRVEAANAPSLGKSELRYQYVLLISDLITYGTVLSKEELEHQIGLTEDILKKNISKKPTEVEIFVQLCNFYLLAGRVDPIYWERGLLVAKQIQKDNPDRTQFLYLIGQMNLALGQTEVGLGAFRQAALRRPDVMDTHIQYYKQLSNVGRLREAEDYFDTNISSASNGDIVAVCRHDIFTGRLDLAQAHLALLEQRQAVPDEVAVMRSFLLLAQGKTGEAKKIAEQTVQHYPTTYTILAPYFADLRP